MKSDRANEPWSRRPGAVVVAGALLLALVAVAVTVWRRPVPIDERAAWDDRLEPAPDMRLDLNEADSASLQLLPRIGPTLAQAIIDDRDANGPFASLDDLARVRGVGERTIALIEPHVRVGVAVDDARPEVDRP